MINNETKMYSIPEAAEYLGISPNDIYNARRDKQIEGTQEETGRKRIFFTKEELDKYMESYLLPCEPKEREETNTPPQRLASIEGVEYAPSLLSALLDHKQNGARRIRQTSETSADATTGTVEQPKCHRCQRQFSTEREYFVEQFVEENKPVWYPVCRDGRCDPATQTAQQQRQIEKTLLALKEIRGQIDAIIAELEGEKK